MFILVTDYKKDMPAHLVKRMHKVRYRYKYWYRYVVQLTAAEYAFYVLKHNPRRPIYPSNPRGLSYNQGAWFYIGKTTYINVTRELECTY